MKLTGIFFGIIGLVFLAVGIGNYVHSSNFLKKAVEVNGVVVKNTGGAGYKGVYNPVVKFTDLAGQSHEFMSTSGSNPAKYKVDEQVTVLFRQEQPESARIKSWFSLWGIAVIFSGIGLILFALPIIVFLALKTGFIKVDNIQHETVNKM